jgi:hypothetical protein
MHIQAPQWEWRIAFTTNPRIHIAAQNSSFVTANFIGADRLALLSRMSFLSYIAAAKFEAQERPLNKPTGKTRSEKCQG